MENNIQIFSNAEFGDLRTSTFNGKTWFNLSDVCKALDLLNPRQVKTRLQERGVIIVDTPIENQFGTVVMQQMNYIDEGNLYRCIFQSRKAEAELFQDWVFDVVLPQIRQTGGYIPVDKDDDEKLILAKAVLILQNTIEHHEQQLHLQQTELNVIRPKAEFADAVTESEGSIYVGRMAKILAQNGYPMGQTRLFSWLRHHGYLYHNKHDDNVPYQKWVEKGFFETQESTFNGHTSITTMVTPKGQRAIFDHYTKEYQTNNQ